MRKSELSENVKFTNFIERNKKLTQRTNLDLTDPNQNLSRVWTEAGTDAIRLSTREWFQNSPSIEMPNQKEDGWLLPFNYWLNRAGAGVIYNSDIDDGNIAYPDMRSIDVQFVAEGKAANPAEPQTAVVSATPSTAISNIRFSRRARHLAKYDIELYLRQNVANAMLSAIQSKLLTGLGGVVGEPAGILNSQHAGTFTDTTSIDDGIASAVEAVAVNRGQSLFIVAANDVRKKLMTTFRNSGSSAYWQHGNGSESVMGIPAATDNGMPSGTMVIGDFGSASVFMSTEMEHRLITTNADGIYDLWSYLNTGNLFDPSRFSKVTITV